ncbi:ion transporter [Crocosphaera watsonii WH 8501]|uniref:Ion transport protein:Ion transport protein n=1 Tax=Crocosphaera watsonii WH 8501 TaxID=165597 RepID=Q4C4Z2_CROWT|nr:ion transporter [Crocosphaera watsonii]EAM51320.1 Ion transport protein:Ion transport protein [Crocosphaera watsonii WH 8501]
MEAQNFTFKEKISHYLDDFNSPIGVIVNLIILGFILLSSGIFVIETYPLYDTTLKVLGKIDGVILSLFTIEYLIRFWCAESKVKFIFSIFSFIDLLSILPLFVGFIDIRFIRILRWFRILRLLRLIKFETSLFKIKSEDGIILVRIFLIIFSLVFIYSGAIYQVEHYSNPEVFKTFFDALYFSVFTMTTVGFGDVIPLSEAGKILTVIMIFSGILLIPWQLSILTQKSLQNTQQGNQVCSHCGLKFHDRDANNCKICGTKL